MNLPLWPVKWLIESGMRVGRKKKRKSRKINKMSFGGTGEVKVQRD
jgi:hypothetical protein